MQTIKMSKLLARVCAVCILTLLCGTVLAACSDRSGGIHYHELTEDDWVDMVPSTCSTHGVMGHYTCPICGRYFNQMKREVSEEKLELPLLEHTLEPWVEPTEATCINPGVPGYYRCTTCWQVFDAEMNPISLDELTISQVDHKPVWVEESTPTCTEEGCAAHWHCTVCGKDFDENMEESDFTIPVKHTDPVLTKLCTVNEAKVPRTGYFVCNNCNQEYKESITSENTGMPVLLIKGSTLGISKENEVSVKVSYSDSTQQFESNATMKLQGATSLEFPKKNYNIQFFNSDGTKKKVELVEGWGKESKYCLKANYIDFSQSRNVVLGKLYSQTVHSRDIDDEVADLYNGGAVDGYPVLVYYNDAYMGLYTLNIPKAKWMFGMSEKHGTREAVLETNARNDYTRLEHLISEDFLNQGFEIEYCSTEDTSEGTDWVIESFNDMMYFAYHNDGQSFKNGIGEYVNIERTIDSMLLTIFMCGYDNMNKNILWLTYDGQHWFSSVYDMDGALGLSWSGKTEDNVADYPSTYLGNHLWKKIYSNFYSEVVARYKELRGAVWSKGNINELFSDFQNLVPVAVYQAEYDKYTGVPSRNVDCFDDIHAWINERLIYLDGYLGVKIEEDEAEK